MPCEWPSILLYDQTTAAVIELIFRTLFIIVSFWELTWWFLRRNHTKKQPQVKLALVECKKVGARARGPFGKKRVLVSTFRAFVALWRWSEKIKEKPARHNYIFFPKGAGVLMPGNAHKWLFFASLSAAGPDFSNLHGLSARWKNEKRTPRRANRLFSRLPCQPRLPTIIILKHDVLQPISPI